MAETELIRRMADDVAALKEQMSRIEVAINEIDMDIHREVNPQYLKKLEKIDAGRTILISSGKNYLTLSLYNENTKAILKINDFKEYEFIAKTENGKLNIYSKPKVAELIERWIHPVNNYNLKMWIHPPNSIYCFPSIGIEEAAKEG